MAVAGLGDFPPVFLASRRVLGGNQAEVGHEATGRVEAHEVVQLGNESHGREGVDTPEAPEGRDDGGVPGIEADQLEPLVETPEAFFDVFEGEQIVLEHPLVFLVLKTKATQPEPMPLAPCLLPAVPGPAVAQDQLAHSMASPDQIAVGILAGAT